MRKGIKQGVLLFTILLLPFLLYFSLVIISKDENLIATLPVINPHPGLQLRGAGFSEANFRNKVSVLVFNGDMDPLDRATISSLYEEAYHPYRLMKDFQLVSFVTSAAAKRALQKDLIALDGRLPQNWKIYLKSCSQLKRDFKGLKPQIEPSAGCGSSYVLLLDKDLALRGRVKDPKYGAIHAYDASNIAMLSHQLDDDIHILLAEYRLELKKNNKYKLKKP